MQVSWSSRIDLGGFSLRETTLLRKTLEHPMSGLKNQSFYFQSILVSYFIVKGRRGRIVSFLYSESFSFGVIERNVFRSRRSNLLLSHLFTLLTRLSSMGFLQVTKAKVRKSLYLTSGSFRIILDFILSPHRRLTTHRGQKKNSCRGSFIVQREI